MCQALFLFAIPRVPSYLWLSHGGPTNRMLNTDEKKKKKAGSVELYYHSILSHATYPGAPSYGGLRT